MGLPLVEKKVNVTVTWLFTQRLDKKNKEDRKMRRRKMKPAIWASHLLSKVNVAVTWLFTQQLDKRDFFNIRNTCLLISNLSTV